MVRFLFLTSIGFQFFSDQWTGLHFGVDCLAASCFLHVMEPGAVTAGETDNPFTELVGASSFAADVDSLQNAFSDPSFDTSWQHTGEDCMFEGFSDVGRPDIGHMSTVGDDTSLGPEQPASEQTVREDLPMPRADYNRILFEARMESLSDTDLKLPWEQGIWKSIFSDDDSDVFPSVLPPVPGEYFVPSSASQPADADASRPLELGALVKTSMCKGAELPFYTYAIKVLPDRDAMQETDQLWGTALFKWQQVFEILNYPGQLGTALLSEQITTDPSQSSSVLRDAMGIKSPRTCIKRAQTMLQYLSWLQMQFAEISPWDRSQCLEYLRFDGQSKQSASKGLTLLEALRFSRFVLGIPIPDTLLNDPQLRGRAQRLMAEKEIYKPARPLKVSELKSLESAMQDSQNPVDVYMLGAVVFAVLSRSRWSDLKYIDQIWLEKVEYNGEIYGFVEARTKHHKTATSLAKKQRYMPLVAPVLGVSGVDWTAFWLWACGQLGVDWEVEPFGALCRAASHDGSLCKRSCTTEEVSTFLNKVLQTNAETYVTSHSLKHTTLSWAAAYGLDEPSRTLLGHHELQGSKAMSVYSRDMLTKPLQLFCSMLTNIRLDHFRPDESRTSRMVDLLKIGSGQHATARSGHADVLTCKADGQPPADDVSCVPTTPLGDDSQGGPQGAEDGEESSEIASTGSSSDDSSSDRDEQNAEYYIPGPVWRNIRSHVVHKCATVSRQTLCGRLVDTAHFELLDGGCSTLNARCSRCFKGELITNVEGLVNALDHQKLKRQRAK